MPAYSLAGLVQIAFGLSLASHLLLLIIALRTRADGPGRLLLAAIGFELIWALINLLALFDIGFAASALFAAEMMRGSAWALFLLSLLGTLEKSETSQSPMAAIYRSLSLPRSAILTSLAGLVGLGLTQSSLQNHYLIAISLLLSVTLLLLLEQVWRNTAKGRRWGIKFIGIALLLKFGLDLVIYSDALLFNRLLAETWALRGFAGALLVPLIAVAAVRNKEWRLDIGVSRQVVFYSATLFASGVFLVLVALGGYYLRLFGGTWGIVATGLLVFAAVGGLLIALASGTLRARLRVFIAKNFFSYRYNYREEWVRLARLMGALERSEPGQRPREQDPNDTLAHRAIDGIASLVESTGGAIWLRDNQSGNYRCEAVRNRPHPLPSIMSHEPLITFCREHDWIIDLHSGAINHPTWKADKLPDSIASDSDAVLLVPLRIDDELLGLVLLDRLRIRFPMNWEVYDMLKIAASQVASYLAVRQSTEALLMTQEFDTFNRMSAFVVHDLKNQVSQLSLILSSADKHSHDPEFQQDVLETVKEVFQQMQELLLQLTSGKRSTPPATASLNLADLLGRVMQQRKRPDLESQLIISPAIENISIEADRERLERAIGNLVQNAIDATPAGGTVKVQANEAASAGRIMIDVTDNGEGMTEAFIRTRLFKPFTSTKEAGMGVGAFESLEYFRKIGGSLDVSSRPGEGSSFRIELPLSTHEQH